MAVRNPQRYESLSNLYKIFIRYVINKAEDIATGKSVALNSHRLTIDTASATTSHWLVIDTARCHYKPQNSY